jgi:hypothetical protein
MGGCVRTWLETCWKAAAKACIRHNNIEYVLFIGAGNVSGERRRPRAWCCCYVNCC